MKLDSCRTILFVTLALAACDSKSSKSSSEHQDADAAITAEEHCEAAHDHMGLHGDLTGYTAAKSGLFHVKVEWAGPLTAGTLDNKATVTFVDEHAESLPTTLLGFKLFMPAMGHGSGKGGEQIVTQDAAHKNVWTVDRVYFSMGGGANEWVVDIEAGRCGMNDTARVIIPVEVK